MGFSNSVLAAFKKMGCMSEPRVQETTYTTLLPDDQADELDVVHIQVTEGKEEDDSKGSSEATEDENDEPNKEKPKSEEACSELKEEEEEEESKSDKKIQEEKIAREVEAN
ncbi:hypothetical protein ACOSQ3_004692 [Xanthoceras sorbifolium]